MPNTREKLIELLTSDYCPLFLVFGDNMNGIIDYLIANGVTVQEWIPVTERLPTEDDADDDGFMFAYTAEKRKIIARWTDVCIFSEFVTHWMPLPQPPKGE